MTLTEVSALTKKGLIGLAGFIVIVIIARASWGLLIDLKEKLFPTPEEAPEMAFGKLPRLDLPEGDYQPPSYTLDTVDAKLPEFYSQFPVIETKPILRSHLAAKNAKDLATKLGFSSDAVIELSGFTEVHRWTDNATQRTLKVNLATRKVTLETDLDFIAREVNPGSAVSTALVETEAKRQLGQLGLLPEDFKEGEAETAIFKVENGVLVPAAGTVEAQLTEVDLFRQEVDLGKNTYPVLPPNPSRGLISAGLYRAERQVNLASVEYAYQEIDTEQKSTYPLKEIKTAWEELQQLPTTVEARQISISQIYLAYFDSDQPQKFLQPIYVFEGVATLKTGKKADFIKYIPAIADEAIKE